MRIAFLTNDNREIQKKYDRPEPLFGPAPEALLEGFKRLGEEIEVHVICCLQRAPVSSPAKLADNIHYHALLVPRSGWMKTGYQGCIRAVRRALCEIRPDVVHGQGTERDCAVCAVFSGFPNVLTIHGHMARIAELTQAKPLSYYWLAAKLERCCLARTGGVVTISRYTEAMVSAQARRTWVVPNAVDPTFFDTERQPATPQRILCPANISPWKNQAGLVAALEPLARKHEFEVRFAGSFDSASAYGGAFLQQAAGHAWCKVLGSLDRGQLKEELGLASIVVLPSFEDNCPMAILEAAAAAVPVAAARVGGIPDLVRHGETGMLFRPDHPEEIAAAIGQMLEDPGLGSRLAQQARDEARRRFSPDIVARQHVEIYREAGRGS